MIDRQKVKTGRKLAQVSQGARDIFLRDGYSGASVDDIAGAAKVSKATLYSYFPDKRLMFEEAMQTEHQRLEAASPLSIDHTAEPAEAIPMLTRQIAEWLMSAEVVRLHRVHIAEAARFPAVALRYHEVMAKVLRNPLRSHLDRWVARGHLQIDDTALAADQLIRLAGAETQDMAMLSDRLDLQAAQITRVADSAAQLFLSAYSVVGQPGRRLGAAR